MRAGILCDSRDVNPEVGPRLCPILLVLAGCSGDFELPPLVASSKYIDFHTDADATVICMDDRLAFEDRFIERTAELLEGDPPSSAIDVVWDPVLDRSDPWTCNGSADACYVYTKGDIDRDRVVSRNVSDHHELVHAVVIHTLGQGHKILGEGLAEYLGSLNQSAVDDTFPERFKSLFTEGTETLSDYRLAMHFVGSIFARHGAAKFRALHASMPEDAGLEQFAEVFAEEYGQSLDDALAAMIGERVYAVDLFEGCGDGEAREIAWTSEDRIDTTIESSCGDPWFFGAGFVDGKAGFYDQHVIEVTEPGLYELTVTGVGGAPAPLRALLTACSFAIGVESAVGSYGGQPGRRELKAGRHSLSIAFPQRPEARGEATVRLEYVGPPP